MASVRIGTAELYRAEAGYGGDEDHLAHDLAEVSDQVRVCGTRSAQFEWEGEDRVVFFAE